MTTMWHSQGRPKVLWRPSKFFLEREKNNFLRPKELNLRVPTTTKFASGKKL